MKDRKVSTTAMLRTAIQNAVSVIVVIIIGLIALSESGALEEISPYIPAEAYAVITGLIGLSIAIAGAITKIMYIPEAEAFISKYIPALSYFSTHKIDEKREESLEDKKEE